MAADFRREKFRDLRGVFGRESFGFGVVVVVVVGDWRDFEEDAMANTDLEEDAISMFAMADFVVLLVVVFLCFFFLCVR